MNCFLCNIELSGFDGRFWTHPESEYCLAKRNDSYGVPVDDDVAVDEVVEEAQPSEFFEELDLQLFPPVEVALEQISHEHGLERLGGASTGRGWTAFSIYQRCPYLFYRRYERPIEQSTVIPAMEPEARAVGTVGHALLATYFTRMIDPSYPLTPNSLRDELIKRANPEIVNEAWRVFSAYALFYQGENISPLAIEHDLRDPRSGESCRFDLIAYFPEAQSDRLPGTYIVEHKHYSRFDDASLNGWANDGEVLGQVMLWERLKLGLRFGKLRGVIVNILGRQKEPKFHRTTVAPETWQIQQHASDLKITEAQIQTSRATGVFERRRIGCIGRFGKCDLYDHCATSEE